MTINDIKKGIEDKGLYDFIANEYLQFSTYQLKDMLLECIATLTSEQEEDNIDRIIEVLNEEE